MGDDMTLTEYKVPFWKRNVSENPDVVSLKELQGSHVNKSEYIIPSGGLSKFLYPRKTTLLKGAPEYLTKMDGFDLRTSIPFSYESPMYYSNFAKYLEDQMNAAITPNVSFAKEIPSKVRQAENVSEIPASTSRLISDLKNANIISPSLNEFTLATYPNLLNLATKRGIADKLTVTRSTNPSAVDFLKLGVTDDAGAAMKMGTHIRDEIATSTSGRRNRAGLTHLPTDYDALYHYNKLLEVPVDYGYGSHTTIARYPFDYTGSAQDLFSRYSNLNPAKSYTNQLDIKSGDVFDMGDDIGAVIGKAGEKVLQPVKTIADPEYYTMQKKAFDLNDLWLRSGSGKDKTLIEKELGLNFSSSEDAKQFLRKELFSASEKLTPFKTGKIRETDRLFETTYYSPLRYKFEEGGYSKYGGLFQYPHGGLFNYEHGGDHTEPKGLTLGPSKPFRIGFALGDKKWEAFDPNLQFREPEFRPTYSKNLPFEKRVDAYLGFPMKKAYKAAELFAEDGDPVDNYRHSVSGMYTAQALKNRGMSTGASIVASNLAGIGHEIATAFRPENMIKDTRSWKSKLIESGEDMVNNAIGSLLSPVNPKLGEAILKYMSMNNMMPDGVVIPENKEGITRDMYFNKE
jgi:hypothetical protein